MSKQIIRLSLSKRIICSKFYTHNQYAIALLYAYTLGGAILSGDENNRGSITPNKWADLAILSADPMTMPTANLLEIAVEQTYVGGKLMYQK